MRPRLSSEFLLPIAAVMLAVLVVAACAIQLRKDEVGDTVPPPRLQEIDSFAAKLDRCRTVTAEQTAEIENCRHVWAENRRRFFTSTNPQWESSVEGKVTGPAPDTKYQDRSSAPALSPEQSEAR
jgi:conjugative transfer region protein TrbK